MPDRPSHCQTCGKPTRIDCGCCGECAQDMNADEAEGSVDGRKRINRRRRTYGLPPLTTTGGSK